MTNKERLLAEIDKYEHEISSLKLTEESFTLYFKARIMEVENKIAECKFMLARLDKDDEK